MSKIHYVLPKALQANPNITPEYCYRGWKQGQKFQITDKAVQTTCKHCLKALADGKYIWDTKEIRQAQNMLKTTEAL